MDSSRVTRRPEVFSRVHFLEALRQFFGFDVEGLSLIALEVMTLWDTSSTFTILSRRRTLVGIVRDDDGVAGTCRGLDWSRSR